MRTRWWRLAAVGKWLETGAVWLVVQAQRLFAPWQGAHLAYGLACLLMGWLLLTLDASWWPIRRQTVGTPEDWRRLFGWASLVCGVLLVYPVKCRIHDLPRLATWKDVLRVVIYYSGALLGGTYLTVLGVLSGIGGLVRHEAPMGWIFAILAGRFLLSAIGELWERHGVPRDKGNA